MTASTPLSLDDYEAIAAAVMETDRGRWFLAEFARRNRAADTAAVLEALSAVEARLAARPATAAKPSSGVVALIRAAADEAGRMRAALLAIPKQGRSVLRALRRCDELDRALGLALDDLGAARSRPPALLSRPTAGERADASYVMPLAAEAATSVVAADVRAGALSGNAPGSAATPKTTTVVAIATNENKPQNHDDLDDILAETLATELLALKSSTPDPAPEAQRDPMGVAAQAETPPEGAGTHADASPPAFVAETNGHAVTIGLSTSLRPALPKAWTPGLLETLTAEERAILFA